MLMTLIVVKSEAEEGSAEAQFFLGSAYTRGHLLDQDYVMAHMYLNVAAVSGSKRTLNGRSVVGIAIKNRARVEKQMIASQITEAQKLSGEWWRIHTYDGMVVKKYENGQKKYEGNFRSGV